MLSPPRKHERPMTSSSDWSPQTSPKRRMTASPPPVKSEGEIALEKVQMAIETLVDKSCAELSEDVNEEGVLDGGDVSDALEDILEMLSSNVVKRPEKEAMLATALSGPVKVPEEEAPAEEEDAGVAMAARMAGGGGESDDEDAEEKPVEYDVWTVTNFRAWALETIVPLAARAASLAARKEAEDFRLGMGLDRKWDAALEAYERAQVLHPSPQNYKDMAFVAQYANTSKKNREKWLKKAGDVARGDLAAYLYAEGRDAEAVPHIGQLGFRYRIAPRLWQTNEVPPSDRPCPVARLYDRVLGDSLFSALQQAFSPTSAYWSAHDYDVFAGTSQHGYFSHAFPLYKAGKFGLLGQLTEKVFELATFADLPTSAKLKDTQMVEVWAHCKPPTSGHQLHFDTDNEGNSEPKHPILTAVVYLTETGGPTLITEQVAGDTKLAESGYVCWPSRARIGIFAGNVIHGVLPARHTSKGFRISVMLAFWDNVRVRDGDKPGACRPFDLKSAGKWGGPLTKRVDSAPKEGLKPTPVEPYVCSPLWLPVVTAADASSAPGPAQKGGGNMPAYNKCFQGF